MENTTNFQETKMMYKVTVNGKVIMCEDKEMAAFIAESFRHAAFDQVAENKYTWAVQIEE